MMIKAYYEDYFYVIELSDDLYAKVTEYILPSSSIGSKVLLGNPKEIEYLHGLLGIRKTKLSCHDWFRIIPLKV